MGPTKVEYVIFNVDTPPVLHIDHTLALIDSERAVTQDAISNASRPNFDA